jgi:hypothetical protein
MSSEDIKNNAFVHSILVRNYINTQKVEHGVSGEVVTISGSVELRREADYKSGSSMQAAVARTLEKIEDEIRKLPNIEFVKFKLDNWARQGRRWICTETEPAPHVHRRVTDEEKRLRL